MPLQVEEKSTPIWGVSQCCWGHRLWADCMVTVVASFSSLSDIFYILLPATDVGEVSKEEGWHNTLHREHLISEDMEQAQRTRSSHVAISTSAWRAWGFTNKGQVVVHPMFSWCHAGMPACQHSGLPAWHHVVQAKLTLEVLFPDLYAQTEFPVEQAA